jgi:ketosteroid isomerase-like protein
MSDPRENLEITAAAFEAFARGDIDGVLALADPDIVVYMPSTLPNSGTYRGHDGYLKWMGQWLEAWEDFKIDVVEMTPVGSRHVVVDTRQHGVGVGSGIAVEQDMIYMTEIREGRFVALQLYPAHAEALEVARRREAEDG